MGELFQNNHHHNKEDANFAKKWYEFDMTYLIMRGLNAVGIIKIKKVQN
jgi:stearoyl-CoA desaturase (delta-9 desaturase)